MPFEDILKSDIFFFVTTIAVIAVTIVAVVMGVYIIKILKDGRSMIQNVKFRYKFVENFIKKIINK